MFNTYFSARYILSKGALISLVLSDRSDGKTFDCKYRALEDYAKNNSITVYMRRFKTEITEKMYNSWFNEVFENAKIPEQVEFLKSIALWQFKGSKKGIQVKKEPKGEWDWIVYFVPLSVAGRLKSQISDVMRINTIDFDEYVPLDNLYLKDEMHLLLEFWKSIDRDRDTTQLIILGNRLTPFNPVFDYFDIELKLSKDRLQCYKDNTIAVQMYSNKEHREQREKGRFRKMIEGTSYEEYDKGGILNAFDIKLKSREGYNYLFSFKTERGEGSVWYKNRSMVISEYIRNDGFIITDKNYNISRKFYVCTYGNFAKNFKAFYRRGDMYFETEKAFYLFEKILIKSGSR